MVKMSEQIKKGGQDKQSNYVFHIYDATTGEIALKLNNMTCSNDYSERKKEKDKKKDALDKFKDVKNNLKRGMTNAKKLTDIIEKK